MVTKVYKSNPGDETDVMPEEIDTSRRRLIRCPFTPRFILCGETSCSECEIRKNWDRQENDRIAENMKDYWKHQACGA